MGLLYRILAELIRMVFFVVTQILVLIGNLSKYKLFNEIDIIKDFTNRVYIIIGVLMLFKLVISAVQYLVNPDSLEDKSKGLSALLQRIVISVGLLVFVPAIFQFAIKVEDIVVEQIPNIVFGNRTDVPKNSNGELDFESSADAIAYNVISGFLVPNTGVTPSTTINQSSFKILNITDILNNGCKDGPIALVSGEGCPYQMGYLALLIPIGLYLVVLFGSLAFEIGERTIKFGVIQILSPVPIVNYISDEKKLGEWSKTAIQVYTDLFIKVFVIYFVIEIIILFLNSFAANSQFQGFEAIMVKIAVIIALCLFAKKAPKFICDLLGIKGADESIGNMFKRAGGMLGAGAAGVTASWANHKNRLDALKRGWDKNTSFGKKLKDRLAARGSAIAGMTSAVSRGAYGAINGKGMKETFSRGHKGAVTARQNREMDNLTGLKGLAGVRARAEARYNQFLGIDTEASLAEGQQKAYSTMHKDIGSIKGAINGRIAKIPNISIRTDVKENSALSQLGKLMEDNYSTILSSGNADLINFANKFERTSYQEKDASGNMVTKYAWQLKAGQSFSYHDIAAINTDATQAGIGSIAGATRDGGPLMQLAQKEIQIDAMRNRAKLTDGSGCDEINIGSGKAHTDVTTAVNAAQQHARENSLAIGKMEFRNKQTGQIEAVYSDETLPNALIDRFSEFDDIIQTRSAELSSKMSQDKNAAALESIKRRDSNKEKK